MADPYFNPHTLYADFHNAYKSVMSRCNLVLNDCPQQSGLAFGLQVQQTSPNNQLNRSILNGENVHSPFNHSRFKQVPVRVIYHQEPGQTEPLDLSVKPKAQQTDESTQFHTGQLKLSIDQVWSLAGEASSQLHSNRAPLTSTLNGTAGNSYSGVGQSTPQSSLVVDSNLHHSGEISNQGRIATVSHTMPQVAFDKPQEDKMLQDQIDSVAHATGSKSERTYFQDYYTKNKDTIRAKRKNYRAKNKDTLRAKQKDYRAKNKDTLRAKRKDYYTKNKETLRAKQQDYRAKNKDTIRAKKKDYRAKNKDTLRAKKQDYYTKNKTTLRAKQQDYYRKNKDTIRAKRKDYREKNKDTLQAKQQDYRAKNQDTIRAKRKDYYTKNKDTIRAKQQDYRAKNKDAIRAKKRDYRAKNKDTIRAKKQDYYTKSKDTIRAKKQDYRAKNKDTLRDVGESSQTVLIESPPPSPPLFSRKTEGIFTIPIEPSHPE